MTRNNRLSSLMPNPLSPSSPNGQASFVRLLWLPPDYARNPSLRHYALRLRCGAGFAQPGLVLCRTHFVGDPFCYLRMLSKQIDCPAQSVGGGFVPGQNNVMTSSRSCSSDMPKPVSESWAAKAASTNRYRLCSFCVAPRSSSARFRSTRGVVSAARFN